MNLIDSAPLTTERPFFQLLVDEDAVREAAAASREDGVVIFQAVDTVDYEPFADCQLAAEFLVRDSGDE